MHRFATHFIPENVAPAGATHIVVLDSGNKDAGKIPLGGLAPPTGKLRLRFCVISDLHITYVGENPEREALVKKTLEYVDADEDCAFTVVCGDLVDSGSAQSHRDNYKRLAGVAQKPVYAISGNHDTIWGYPTDNYMESYTGMPLYYAVANTADNDRRIYGNASVPDGYMLFFLGHYGKDHNLNGYWKGGEPFSAEELAWLESTMAAYPDKRRIIFIHPYIPGGAGDINLTVTPPSRPPNLWTPSGGITTDTGADFLAILARYPGAGVFTGHSHYRYRTQEVESDAIIHHPADDSYIDAHVPSLTKLRDAINGQRVDLKNGDADYGGEGYIVDVYDEYLYLRGRDFINEKWVGIGTYLINT